MADCRRRRARQLVPPAGGRLPVAGCRWQAAGGRLAVVRLAVVRLAVVRLAVVRLLCKGVRSPERECIDLSPGWT